MLSLCDKKIKPYKDLYYLYVIKKINHTKIYAIFMWLKNEPYKGLCYLYVIKKH